MNSTDARLASIGLGGWLFLSAFLLHHTPAHFTNTWLMGIIVILSSAVAIKVPAFRYVTSAAGVWLIASLFAWRTYAPMTVWNNFFIGAGITLTSLVGPSAADVTPSEQIQSPV